MVENDEVLVNTVEENNQVEEAEKIPAAQEIFDGHLKNIFSEMGMIFSNFMKEIPQHEKVRFNLSFDALRTEDQFVFSDISLAKSEKAVSEEVKEESVDG
jgi:hypothetical protein